MKSILQKDTVLTLVGFVLVAAGFVFAVYFPGRKATAAIHAEIGRTEETIKDIPRKVSELEGLKQKRDRQQAFVEASRPSIPTNPDVSRMIRAVTASARQFELHVSRVEPKAAEPHESYQRLPFRLSFHGNFRSIMAFLANLEQSERLFSIHNLTLKHRLEKNTGVIEAEMDFAIYIKNIDLSDAVKISESSGANLADN